MYWKFKKWIYVNIESPRKTMKKLKGIFVPLKLKFRISMKSWYPVIWCSKPSLIQIVSQDVEWKDKWHTPRFECCPYIWIHLFGLEIIWYWTVKNEDEYWEQALWYLYYASYNKKKKGYDPLDINKAKEKWPWKNMDGTSDWNDNFLVK